MDEEYVDPAQMGKAPGPAGKNAPEQTDNGLHEGDQEEAEQKPYVLREPS